MEDVKPEIVEVTAQCSGCHLIETVFFVDDSFQETKRFKLIDNKIYHVHIDDKTIKPCKLY